MGWRNGEVGFPLRWKSALSETRKQRPGGAGRLHRWENRMLECKISDVEQLTGLGCNHWH